MEESKLIVVKQLPVIEDQLRAVKSNIEQRIKISLSMVCTEDTYKDIKRERAALNKERKLLEDRCREVKREILAPWENFEALYNDCAGNAYRDADRILAQRISEVEDGLKKQKHEDLVAFFAEYLQSKGIDSELTSLERSGIKVGMADTRKHLHELAAAYLDKISDDLKLIETQEYKSEIIVEYRKSLNVSLAITSVSDRHKAIEEEKRRREAAEAEATERMAAQEKVESIAEEEQELASPAPMPPTATVIEPEEAPEAHILHTSFRVYGTKEALIALKKFLENGGYRYEQL